MENHTISGVDSLMGIANDPTLQADERPVYVRDEDADPNVPANQLDGLGQDENGLPVVLSESDTHKQVYNPETGRQFDVATSEYEVINPPQFIGPLCEELNERDRTDVAGKVRRYDGGARCYAEILFRETDAIYLEGRSDPVRCGFELRWSHDSGLSVQVRGFAQDTACKNSIRQVTTPIHVKHAGDVDERIDWREEWAGVLDELGAFSESLAQLVEEAREHVMFDLGDHELSPDWSDVTEPLDLLEAVETPGPVGDEGRRHAYDFYDLLGLPSYLGVAATERLAVRLGTKDDPRQATAWDVYSAATYALTHEFRGDVGRSDDDKHRTVKDVLLNPEKAIEDARLEAASRRETPREDAPGLGADPEADVDETAREALQTESERSRELEFGG